ncbi:iron ABC transporter permease [SAR86 cluster bacterium]|nr:iron ABC transporter permease [SAR86 cluster bacterium]
MILKINSLDLWKIIPIIIFITFVSPVAIVLFSLTGDYSENWLHLIEYVLTGYIINSSILVLGVSLITLIIGVGTAWLISNYEFSGKRFFEWALILPLAVPPYILAYTFTGLFDAYGSVNNLIRDIFSFKDSYIFFPSVRNIYGAIIVFSFTLYPYVYLASRMAFLNQSKSILESGKVLGLDKIKVFFNLALPMVRPAVIGGLMLVIMETLSDFGAVDHFAIETFTTGIFRTWYGMYDLQTAMQLASLLLIFITFFIVVERYSRKNVSYAGNSSVYGEIKSIQVFGINNLLCFGACGIPLFIGFILPIIELLNWTYNYKLDFFEGVFIRNSLNTIYLAISAALICSISALLINFSIRFTKNKFLSFLSSTLTLGYAVPGLILAIGVMKLLTFLDLNFFSHYLELILTGSIAGLIIAYIIKSYALASSVIEAGYQRIGSNIDDVSITLKNTGLKLLGRVHLPLLKTSFLTSILLVVSEVIKELPATLILRPFNFDTLAVSTYIYASEERMFEAAAPAIAIVLVGLIPIIFLTRMIRESRPGSQNRNVNNA